MTSRYYTMTDSTGESGFLPTVTFTSGTNTFDSTQRTTQLATLGITGFYEADFADNITTIASNAFFNDIKVVVVTINKVTSIGNNAFNDCTALRSITLDCAVDATTKKYLLTSIGVSAFSGCILLRHLHIPDTVKNIPSGMCYGCTSLEIAVMGYGWNRSGNDYVADSTIGTYAFANCIKLTDFVVPETVSSISNNAFEFNSTLALVTILGRPTIGTNVFNGAMGTNAIYTFDNSASYVTLTTATDQTFVPAGATKRAYREVTFTATGDLTDSTVVSALSSVTSWWKGKILNGVTAIGTAATPAVFRPYSITAAKYSNMIGMSFPSTLTTIRYGAFEGWVISTTTPTYAPCNVTAFYFPNSVVSFPQYDGATISSATFNLGTDANRNASSTKQFVFLSGTNTVTLGREMFGYNSAKAFIIPTITGIPYASFYICRNALLFSFFQKNAYTLLTTIGNDTQYVLEGCFTSGISGYRHYIHIPRQAVHIGADAFRNIPDKLVVTVYHNTVNSAGVTQLTGLVTSGYFTWNSSNATGNRFQGPISPTVLVINNNYDVNGIALTASSEIGTGFPYHVLYSANVKTITNRFAGLVDLKSIAVHHSATNLVDINSQAFYNCSGLNYVYLNNRVNSIGSSSLRNAPLNASFDLIDAAPLVAIFDAAFHTDIAASNITQITIPNTVKAIGAHVFGGASGLKPNFTKLSFENGIAFWGDYDYTRHTTANASNISTIYGTNTGDAAYMAIPAYFCQNCKNLTSVSFLDTAIDLSLNPVPADANGTLARPNTGAPIPTRYNKQILNPPIKRIGQYAFISNYRLQSIRIPDGVTTIDLGAFYDAYSVTYLYLPDTLTTMGLGAFNYVGAGNQFNYSGLEVSVRIPQAMIDFVVPDTGSGGTGYFNTNFTATRYFTVSFDNTSASGKVSNGVLGRFTSSAVNTYIKYHVITLNGITGILGGAGGTTAFDGFTGLKTVTIADTVTDFGLNAFISCTGLTNVFISPTSNLTIIGESAINNCTSLTSFFIPNSVKYISPYAFSSSSSLATVTYGDNPGLKSIGANAFYGTTKALTSIFIPASVVYIGFDAFITGLTTDVNILNTVTFGAGSRLKSIEYRCFGYDGYGIPRAAQYLRDLVLPSSLRYMGPANTSSSPLQNTHRLAHSANLVVPSSVEVIPWAFLYADTGVTDISNVYFPRSITNVAGPRIHNGYSLSGGLMGAEAYSNKSGSLIYLPSELSGYVGYNDVYSFFVVTTVGHSTVARTRSYYRTVSYTTNPLLTLNLSGTVANTTNATTTTQIHADIKEGVVVIGSGSSIASAGGGNALNLISVNIPSTITTISANAFNGCSAMAYVTFSENSKLTTIGDSAFLGCNTIHDIQLPDTVTTIGANAFSGCYNLASISIPYNVTSIGAGAFNININTPATYIARPAACLAYKLGGDIYGEAISDYSGYCVSLSQDGKILAIGAYLNDGGGGDSGHVRVYKYQTITDTTWTNYTVNSYLQTGTSPYNKPIVINGGDALPVSGKSYWVQLGSDINGETGYNYAGWSVSLSSDGTTVAIGALVNYGAGGDAGQTRVYKYQTIAAADWTNYTVNSFTHTGTAPTNKPIVVNGGDANPVSGKLYWVQLGADIDGETVNSQSGNSVSLSSNGQIVAIGARFDDLNGANNSGSVRVYQYNGTAWSKLGSTITAGSADDEFGWFVSLNDAGTVVAIGASLADNGAASEAGIVRVYAYSSNTWTQRGSNIIGDAQYDYSGVSVSLNSDGTILAIGAIGNDGTTGLNADNRGQVRVYNWNGSSWVKLGQNINGLASGDEFGVSVSLNTDGTILAVGSRHSASGFVSYTGLVRIYKYIGTTWQQLGQDIKGNFADDNAAWLVSLSRDGTTVAFGLHPNDGNGTDSGMVRVYQINQFTVPIRLHQKLYNDISGSLSTYFPGINTSTIQVVPALTLTNTLNPAKLTISQINNMYIRYRQSQLGCTRITVSASSGGSLQASDVANALASSTGLVHLDIGTNVTIIAAGAFAYSKLRIYSVAISKTVTAIRESAFNGCTNLSYLSFHPDSACTNIGLRAFFDNNIIDLALPDSLTTFEGSTFWSSSKLTSVCIPKNVTSINVSVFINCPKLTSVALPASLAAYANGSYFSQTGSSAAGITFSYYSAASAISHFKLSDYSMPNGMVQTVIDSAVKYIDHLAYAYYPDITLYAVTTNKQTQTPGQYSYTVNNVQMPIMPAAFTLNGSTVIANSIFPIYRSVPDLNVFTGSSTAAVPIDSQDDFYILMPGYSICIYNNLYDEENVFTDSPTYRYYDNEFGNVPLNITINVVNTTSSILIMFNGRILSKYFAS
jgi:hypothetical protein